MMNKSIIVVLIFMASCSSYSQHNNKNDKNLHKNYKIEVNSFLDDKNISQLAKDLYSGKVKPTDSDENLALIDSINSVGHARGFYFLAITKTMQYADGTYSEPLGIATKEFIVNNTVEFLSNFKDNPDLLTNNDFENWARTTYGEIQISSEESEQKAVSDLETIMIANCQGLSKEFKDKALEFTRLMKKIPENEKVKE